MNSIPKTSRGYSSKFISLTSYDRHVESVFLKGDLMSQLSTKRTIK